MAGQVIQRGKNVWLVRVFLGRDATSGKRQYHNHTIHGVKKDAQAYLANALSDQSKGAFTGGARTKIAELLDDLLLDYKTNGKDHEWAERVVRVHLRAQFGSIRAAKLETTQILQYIDGRQKVGDENSTINRALALLKRSFHLGKQCTPAKVTVIPYIPMLQEKNVRKGFFEHEDYLKMRDELSADVRPVLTFAYYTGCRRGEILSLQWRQVDLCERMVRLDPDTTKNDEPRVIPIDGELYETMAMQRTLRDAEFPSSPWVFSRNGDRIIDIRGAWDAASEKVGLWDPDAKKATKLFHDLRRSGVRNLIRAGVPEKTAMAISGHKTRSVFDRYNIVNESDLKTAARRLSDYLATKTASKPISETDRHTIGTQAENQGDTGTVGNPSKLLN
jgi:integrase